MQLKSPRFCQHVTDDTWVKQDKIIDHVPGIFLESIFNNQSSANMWIKDNYLYKGIVKIPYNGFKVWIKIWFLSLVVTKFRFLDKQHHLQALFHVFRFCFFFFPRGKMCVFPLSKARFRRVWASPPFLVRWVRWPFSTVNISLPAPLSPRWSTGGDIQRLWRRQERARVSDL